VNNSLIQSLINLNFGASIFVELSTLELMRILHKNYGLLSEEAQESYRLALIHLPSLADHTLELLDMTKI
jgi:hypothetical protein